MLVDGTSIDEDLAAWQRSIGLVPQDVYLLDDSLRANIAFGEPDELIDDERVRSAVRLAQLEEHVASLPEGLETRVGERGARLSGGQRQRLGIARALYRQPAVLVLDEATSSLDNETERRITDVIRALHGEVTVIVVAHRLSTVHELRPDRLPRGRSDRGHGAPSTRFGGRARRSTTSSSWAPSTAPGNRRNEPSRPGTDLCCDLSCCADDVGTRVHLPASAGGLPVRRRATPGPVSLSP